MKRGIEEPYSYSKIGQKHTPDGLISILINKSFSGWGHFHTDIATELISAGATKLPFFIRPNTETFPSLTNMIPYSLV